MMLMLADLSRFRLVAIFVDRESKKPISVSF